MIPDRRNVLKWATMMAGAASVGPGLHAQPASGRAPAAGTSSLPDGGLRKGMLGFMLAHEQFPVPELVRLGAHASQAGFQLLATSDHLQPWQANQGHCGEAWVTLGALCVQEQIHASARSALRRSALGSQAQQSWMGTTVTCPTMRYNPAVVAEAFASLSLLHPGRVFLGVGSGEALNEEAVTGVWPHWQERWDRLIEAIEIIRALWTGQSVSHKGQHYSVQAKLYDPPPQPVPLLTAANGRKSMRLAGQYGDGLITDPKSWQQHKGEWEAGARAAGKDPGAMPVLVEQYVVVGDESDARQAASLWRFGPKAFKTYYDIRDPAEIQQRAEKEITLEQVFSEWPVSTDPAVHIAAVRKLFESGATIVNVHAGQPDQTRVIDFYAAHVLPAFGHAG